MSGFVIVSGLAHAAVGGTVLLTAGLLAVLCCRQPVRRIRLIELTLLGALAVPFVSHSPWLPHWSMGLLRLADRASLPDDVTGPRHGSSDNGAEPIVNSTVPQV